MSKHRLDYRPEIDGLRAVAILSVFVFHLNRDLLPGGFVGVDIFFVISGYLITAILYEDCKSGQFSIARFYQRRIARIVPAFFTVAIATTAAAAFVYSSQDFASVGANLVAASLSVANVKYLLQGDYFQISPDAQPFLHYWSLSVEEQFYLIFPLMFYLIFRYEQRYLTLIFALIGIGSFAACVVLTEVRPVWAFYLLPMRAWELGFGGLLAILVARDDGRCVSLASWMPALGLVLMGGSFALIHEGPHFPGWQAAFPVAGAGAIILYCARSPGRVQQWLSSTTMVEIGKLSYSLYLWHWPVFSLVDYRFYVHSAATRLMLKIGLSVILAVTTFRFIERPARVFLNQAASRRISFATMASLLILCIPSGLVVRQHNYINADLADVANGGLVFDGRLGGPTVVLMGDSHGSMYGKTMKEICADFCEKLTIISAAAGDPLPSLRGESSKLWVESLETLRKSKPDFLFLATAWLTKLHDEPNRLAVALEQIKPHVGHTILLNQPPVLPVEANRSHIRDGSRPPFFEAPETRVERRKVNDLLLKFQSSNVSVVDVSKHFEAEDGQALYIDTEGRELYQDASHLSSYGTERIREILKEEIAAP